VYFDSVTIRHPRTELRISQEHHYYPFGLNLQGVAVNTQPAAAISKAQFNGGSELEEELMDEGGVYSTPYRTYDPTIGRFQGVDPLADMYADQTPYNFAFNDPANLNDPSGADPLSDLALNNPTLGNTLVFAAQGYGDPGGSGFGGFNTYGRLPAGGSASYSGGLLNVSGTTRSTSTGNAPTYSSWAFSIAGLTNGVGSLGTLGLTGTISSPGGGMSATLLEEVVATTRAVAYANYAAYAAYAGIASLVTLQGDAGPTRPRLHYSTLLF